MSIFDYNELVDTLVNVRSKQSGKTISKKLRPVQKAAIERAKELEKNEKK